MEEERRRREEKKKIPFIQSFSKGHAAVILRRLFLFFNTNACPTRPIFIRLVKFASSPSTLKIDQLHTSKIWLLKYFNTAPFLSLVHLHLLLTSSHKFKITNKTISKDEACHCHHPCCLRRRLRSFQGSPDLHRS